MKIIRSPLVTADACSVFCSISRRQSHPSYSGDLKSCSLEFRRIGQGSQRPSHTLVDGKSVRLTRDGLSRLGFECRCGPRWRHLSWPDLLCRICRGLSMPDHRLLPERREIGKLWCRIRAPEIPFAPIAPQPRARHRWHKTIRRIYAAETRLLDRLHQVRDVLSRRLSRRRRAVIMGDRLPFGS